MENKHILIGTESMNKVVEGVNILNSMVSVTLGPKGKNILIEKHGGLEIVNDGVTIARNIFLEDRLMNLGASMMKNISKNTESDADDGTTTSTVLGAALINVGIMKLNEKKYNIIAFKEAMNKYLERAIEHLTSKSIVIEKDSDLKAVAYISANNDEKLAQLLYDAYNQVGQKGAVTVKTPRTYLPQVTITKGMVYDRGYLSKFFVNDRPNNRFQEHDCLVALVSGTVENAMDVLPLMELAGDAQKPLLIIADKFKDDAIICLTENRLQGFPVCAVNSPGLVDENINYLADLAAVLGGTVLNEKGSNKTIHSAELSDLGIADNAEVYAEHFQLEKEERNEELVAERIAHLEELKNKTKEQFWIDLYDTRLAKLQGGIATIYPGGRSEPEIEDNIQRAKDALGALRSALDGGVIAGGGAALFHTAKWLRQTVVAKSEEEKLALDLMCISLHAPIGQILSNAGVDKDEVMNYIRLKEDFWMGYDVVQDKIVNMYDAGIIDPLKVTVNALSNAVSVAVAVLNMGGSIVLRENVAETEQRRPLFQ